MSNQPAAKPNSMPGMQGTDYNNLPPEVQAAMKQAGYKQDV